MAMDDGDGPNKKLTQRFGGLGDYRRYLGEQLGRQGEDAEARARTRAFEDVGRSTQTSLMASRDAGSRAFGVNVPTGFQGAHEASIVQHAPYGTANIGAEEAGVRRMLQSGQALQNLGLAHANFYQVFQGLELQRQALENQAAVAAGSAQGGGLFGGLF